MSFVAHFRGGGPLDGQVREVEGTSFEIVRNLGFDRNHPHNVLVEKGHYEKRARVDECIYVYLWRGWGEMSAVTDDSAQTRTL